MRGLRLGARSLACRPWSLVPGPWSLQYLRSVTNTPELTIVGGGLAGCEAAWQLAERGHRVAIHEMRPVRTTPAHRTDRLAELVCSNTFKSTEHSK